MFLRIKIIFFPKFIYKDCFIVIIYIGFFVINLFIILEEENFIEIDLVSSPLHIKPE